MNRRKSSPHPGFESNDLNVVMAFVLDLYRAAQDTPADEFQTLALRMLQALVPSRSALWTHVARTPRGNTIYGMHLYNEPDELSKELPGMNNRHSATIEQVFAKRGAAVALYTPDVFSRPEEAEMRDYIRRFGHENNLAVADLGPGVSSGEWISLFRPEGEEPFSAEDRTITTVLVSHLAEALAVNRKLTMREAGLNDKSLSGTRALVHVNGNVIHCGPRFCEMLSEEWFDWQYTRLPSGLLNALQRTGTATVCNGSIHIEARKFGGLMLLSAKRVSVMSRLTNRELEVVQLYGSGKSYKEIARTLQLAPTTVRNFVQMAYRKIGVENKVDLARFLNEV